MTNQPQNSGTEKRASKWDAPALIALCIAVFFVILLISNLSVVNSWFKVILTILRPLIIGLIITYIAAPFFRLFEHKILFRVHPPFLRRSLALLFTYASLFCIIAVLVMLIVPQLYDSAVNFVSNFDTHLDSLIVGFNRILVSLNERLPEKADGSPAFALLNVSNIQAFFENLWNSLIDFITARFNFNNFSLFFDVIEKATTLITDIVFGLFVSLYLLNSKEKRYAQIMRFRNAFFSEKLNAQITSVISIADRSFGSFLRGKILDSTIVGFLTYFACLIFRVPYPVLIAAIVGITDILPIIGPFIGTVPAGIIIFLTEPLKVIPFVIAIIIIQQIDGNIMAPKILGNQVGVSSFCVLSAIVIMGNLWGFAGMLLGVPIFATIAEFFKKYLEKRLKDRSLPDNMESYYNPEMLAEISDVTPKNSAKRNLFRKFLSAPTQLTEGKGMLTDLEKEQLRKFAVAKDCKLFDGINAENLQNFSASSQNQEETEGEKQ